MFKIAKRRIAAALAAFVFLAPSLLAPLAAHAQSEQSGKGLTGAWWVTVTLYNCATGATRPPFSSMLLFSRGGTVTETTSNPAFLTGQRSVGFGAWSQNSDDTYTASDIAYILFTGGSGATFQQGTQKLNHTITLNKDASEFTDQATVQFFDPNGALIQSGCATATASRFQ